MRALLRSAVKMLAVWFTLSIVAQEAFRPLDTIPGWYVAILAAAMVSCLGQFAVVASWGAAKVLRARRDIEAAMARDLAEAREANHFRQGLEAALATRRQVIAATGNANEMLRSPRWAYPPRSGWVYENGAWYPTEMQIIDTGPHRVPDEDLIHFFAQPPQDNDHRP